MRLVVGHEKAGSTLSYALDIQALESLKHVKRVAHSFVGYLPTMSQFEGFYVRIVLTQWPQVFKFNKIRVLEDLERVRKWIKPSSVIIEQ